MLTNVLEPLALQLAQYALAQEYLGLADRVLLLRDPTRLEHCLRRLDVRLAHGGYVGRQRPKVTDDVVRQQVVCVA